MDDPPHLVASLQAGLDDHHNNHVAQQDSPCYWVSDPGTLASSASVGSVTFGTGHSLYRTTILPAMEQAESEVILVTCFWARSETQEAISDSLRKLAAKASRTGQMVKVRIYFSSSSLFQKLLHTRSLDGKDYPPSTWQSTFGLPSPDELRGLDLHVKSIFVLPFSVMHPKFVIIDRSTVLLPSCNVSWEDWFEGCMELRGPIVQQFVRFWQCFWLQDPSGTATHVGTARPDQLVPNSAVNTGSKHALASRHVNVEAIQSVFLPSPHHWNPQFRFPWQQGADPPPTPLNIGLLALFAKAASSIFIQSPNITAQPALDALLSALQRGVNVRLVTSERLMVLEQLVTAGTTNKRCMQWLTTKHRELCGKAKEASQTDLESGLFDKAVGRLRVEYYKPRDGGQSGSEPVQSHLKLAVVDDHITIHGSGNMDRASWYTSQELGVAFVSSELAKAIQVARKEAMHSRSEVVYDSRGWQCDAG